MKNFKELLFPACIAVVIAALCSWAYLERPRFLERLELSAFDLRLLARGPQESSHQVSIIAVDEESLIKYGRWPWDRELTAKLVSKIDSYGPKAVGYDIVFSEPQANPAGEELVELIRNAKRIGLKPTLELRRYFKERLGATNQDAQLARALLGAKSHQILGYYFNLDPKSADDTGKNTLGRAARYFEKQLDGGKRPDVLGVPRAFKPRTNTELLAKAVGSQAFFNVIPDADGTIRRYNMVIGFNGTYYQPLAAAMFSRAVPQAPPMLLVTQNGMVGAQWERHFVPTDAKGRMLLNYRGPAGAIPHIPAWKVLDGDVDPALFKHHYLLVGVTAPTVYDLRVTPYGVAYPGLEIHATALDNMLTQDFIRHPEWAPLMDIAAIWIFAGVTVAFLWRARTVVTLLSFTVLAFGFIYANQYFLTAKQYWLNIVYPLLSFAGTYLALNTYRYLFSDLQKKQIRSAFSKYLDPNVVEQVTADPDRLCLGGERLELSVLFSDIRSFTSISEGLSPDNLVALLNEYLTDMTKIVMRNKGLLDKYIGDAVMAVFGAPYHYPEHPVEACNTALEMQYQLEVLNRSLEKRSLPRLAIGIGINTGEMVAGNMGSQERFDYTVMGDNVNLASRLEGLTKTYGVGIIISQFTQEQVSVHFWTRPLDLVRVKGKKDAVEIFELQAPIHEAQPLDYTAEYLEMIEDYRSARFEAGLEKARLLAESHPEDKTVALYLERLQALQADPPEQWDGVWTFTTK
ncbi:MAG: CHASE2 domain-containing protein [Desulfovibrio sp.]|uniref:CHASE2 domain-containing protein n=1 Tax=Desulfovibrio sp. 7SRBS1 TaxID=3378064 RepID=UPI003B423175